MMYILYFVVTVELYIVCLIYYIKSGRNKSLNCARLQRQLITESLPLGSAAVGPSEPYHLPGSDLGWELLIKFTICITLFV